MQYLFRDYLALVSCAAGATDAKPLRKLRRQGGVVPVIAQVKEIGVPVIGLDEFIRMIGRG